MISQNQIDNARASIGALLKIERKDCNWSQLQLAEFLGVSLKTIRDWEAGRSDGPTAVQLGLMEGAGFDTQFIITAGLNHRRIPLCMYDVEWLQDRPRPELIVLKGMILEALNRSALSNRDHRAGEAQ